jgi:hypothetical protein
MKNFIIVCAALLFAENAFCTVVTVCNDFGSDGKSQYSVIIETTENFGIFRAKINEKENSAVTRYEVSRQHFRTGELKQPDSVLYYAKDSEHQVGFKLAINTSKPLEYETYSSILTARLNTGYLLRHLECNFFYKQPRDWEQ